MQGCYEAYETIQAFGTAVTFSTATRLFMRTLQLLGK